MTRFVIVQTTTGSAEEADKIAEALVENKLAACVQTTPVKSTYVWQGKLNKDGEHRLDIKTRMSLFPQVEAAIKALHSYETPEIICLPVSAGSRDYLDWISKNTRPARKMPQP